MSDKNNEFDDDLDQITLTLEDDSELLCDVISVFECNGRDYIALLPADETDGDFLFYRYAETEDGDCELDDIESDEEFEEVADTFEELFDEEEFQDVHYSFDDEEETSSGFPMLFSPVIRTHYAKDTVNSTAIGLSFAIIILKFLHSCLSVNRRLN
ncbi:MAG: DUF1292 domain-containing protein [Lachnospiraceae bacterium]|nr:DUF1292 domain-containing protein [Lachnospiraceae bacterium]